MQFLYCGLPRWKLLNSWKMSKHVGWAQQSETQLMLFFWLLTSLLGWQRGVLTFDFEQYYSLLSFKLISKPAIVDVIVTPLSTAWLISLLFWLLLNDSMLKIPPAKIEINKILIDLDIWFGDLLGKYTFSLNCNLKRCK